MNPLRHLGVLWRVAGVLALVAGAALLVAAALAEDGEGEEAAAGQTSSTGPVAERSAVAAAEPEGANEGRADAAAVATSTPAPIVLPLISKEDPPTPTPSPTPTPTVDPAFLALEESMAAAIAGYHLPANYAVAVTDLQTGDTVAVHGDRPQQSGCVANYLVLVSALQDVQEGRYGLDTVRSLIYATTWSSNASTARELYRITGGGDPVAGVAKVNAIVNEQLGLDAIAIDHPPGFIGESLGLDVANWITAESINAALGALYHGELLEPEYRAVLLDAMATVKPGLNYLTASTPGEVTVSHKNGFFPIPGGGWVDNDGGIVRFERGGTEYAYAITFLAEGVPVRLGDIALGQQLAALAWAYFDARYP